MAYGDTNNTSQSIGGGTSVPLPDAIKQAGIKEDAWQTFVLDTALPFVKQYHRLPTMRELNSAVTASR